MGTLVTAGNESPKPIGYLQLSTHRVKASVVIHALGNAGFLFLWLLWLKAFAAWHSKKLTEKISPDNGFGRKSVKIY
jgi:hypothetical protein